MKKTTLISIVFAVIIWGCSQESQTTQRQEIESSYDFDAQPDFSSNSPYDWGYSMLELESQNIDSSIFKSNHPLDIGRHALYLLLHDMDSTFLDWKPYIDYLKNYSYKVMSDSLTEYAYGFNHDSFEEGKWWSAMANSVIALAYLEAFNKSQDSTYYIEYEKSKNALITPTALGGCKITLSDSAWWYLEYASQESTMENSNFVLNGFLFSLLGMKHMADRSKDHDLLLSYQKGVNAFIQYSERFYYETNDWTYYKLNPLTIEPPHYAVFDILIMRSLLELDSVNADLWKSEIARRSEILMRAYPVYLTSDSSLYFSMIGPPHPYWIDTYPLKLDIKYDDGTHQYYKMPNPRDVSQPLLERAIHSITIDSDKSIDKIDVYAQYGLVSILIYSINELREIEAPKVQGYNFQPRSENVLLIGSNWVVKGDELTDFEVNVRLPAPEISHTKYYGFVFNPSFNVRAVRLFALPESGVGAERYYQVPITNENNYILFHLLGFKNIDQIEIEDSTQVEIRLKVYPESLSDSTLDFKLDSLHVFNSIWEANNFMIENELFLPEKGKRGNIY